MYMSVSEGVWGSEPRSGGFCARVPRFVRVVPPLYYIIPLAQHTAKWITGYKLRRAPCMHVCMYVRMYVSISVYIYIPLQVHPLSFWQWFQTHEFTGLVWSYSILGLPHGSCNLDLKSLLGPLIWTSNHALLTYANRHTKSVLSISAQRSNPSLMTDLRYHDTSYVDILIYYTPWKDIA